MQSHYYMLFQDHYGCYISAETSTIFGMNNKTDGNNSSLNKDTLCKNDSMRSVTQDQTSSSQVTESPVKGQRMTQSASADAVKGHRNHGKTDSVRCHRGQEKKADRNKITKPEPCSLELTSKIKYRSDIVASLSLMAFFSFFRLIFAILFVSMNFTRRQMKNSVSYSTTLYGPPEA